jgi:hypothetical protein
MGLPHVQLRRPVVLAIVGGLVVLGGAGTTLALVSGGGQQQVLAAAGEPSVPPATTDPADAAATPTASVTPSPTPTAAQPQASVAPALTTTPRAGSAPAAPAAGATPARCLGTPPPTHMSDPSCDVYHPHQGLPTDCISYQNSCAWPDAWGANPGGIFTFHSELQGRSIALSWVVPVHGTRYEAATTSIAIGVFTPDWRTLLRLVEVPASQTTYLVTDLPDGTYRAGVAEVNPAGRSFFTMSPVYQIGAAPTPSPPAASPPAPSPTGGSATASP